MESWSGRTKKGPGCRGTASNADSGDAKALLGSEPSNLNSCKRSSRIHSEVKQYTCGKSGQYSVSGLFFCFHRPTSMLPVSYESREIG